MKVTACLKILICASVFVGCAAAFPPPELIDARQACSHASGTPSTQLAPAEMRKVREALAIAEKSFVDDPHSDRTRNLASLAYRLAKQVEALGKTASDSVSAERADREYEAKQTETMKNIREDLAMSGRGGRSNAVQHATEQERRRGIARQVADVKADLANLAVVTEDARGLVITLSDDLLFPLDRAMLVPSPQDGLEKIVDVLMATKDRKLTVESHTDSRGSPSHNRELSQRRADAVRLYIISRGYLSDLIVAHGVGDDRPVADNLSAEGRAMNRRLEIVVNHTAKQYPGGSN